MTTKEYYRIVRRKTQKDDDEGILPYCEEEDAEKFYFQQILTARFSWESNNILNFVSFRDIMKKTKRRHYESFIYSYTR